MVYLWIALGTIVGIALLIAALLLALRRIGKTIPVEHQATSVIDIHAPIEKVFDAIADIERHPTWAKGMKRAMLMPEHNGMQTVRVDIGHNSFVMVRTRYEPPMLLERTITDDHGPFSGTWLYKLRPMPGDGAVCEVRLTETGRVSNPAARAIMKHMFGYHMYTNKHLRNLAAKFEPNPPQARKG
jgi:uncharacterized protein YndB with AHSA1/START domain